MITIVVLLVLAVVSVGAVLEDAAEYLRGELRTMETYAAAVCLALHNRVRRLEYAVEPQEHINRGLSSADDETALVALQLVLPEDATKH